VLEHIARHEILTINQLVYLIYGTLNGNDLKVAQTSIQRTVRTLKAQKYLQTRFFRTEGFKGRGKYPNAIWLLEKGAEWARDNCPQTDPKYHGDDRSDNNIMHDLKRSDARIAIYDLCAEHNLAIGWKKTDLFHQIKPDDLFEITKNKTLHFFLELERTKKPYRIYDTDKRQKSIYDKLFPYTQLYGTQQCKDLFGFKYFTVIIPMRDDNSARNLLVHLDGGCNCPDPTAKRLHRSQPLKMNHSMLYITALDKMQSPSFLLDIVR
jgi:hypothetical protein